MKKIILPLFLLALSLPAFAVQKEFSPRTTFPFKPGGYRIEGVPRNVIFLTIDDGPTTEGTPAMLDVLEDHQIKATFFVVGNQAKRNSHLLERMYREGHLIGNHSYSHEFDFPTASNFTNSLLGTHQLIAPYMPPERIWLYRSPGGIWNSWRSGNGNAHRILERYVGPLFWNVGGGEPGREDDADWKCWRRGNGVTVNSCADSYYQQIIRNYQRGQASLVLVHDLKSLSARLVNTLIKRLKRDGVNWEFRLADEIPVVQELAR